MTVKNTPPEDGFEIELPDSIDIGQENALRLLEQHGYIKSITEIEEPALTGCVMNPSGGTRGDALLSDPLIRLPKAEPVHLETPQASVSVQNATEIMRIQRMPFPPVAPPEPPQSPVTTPEPPTIAILTLTGLALLFILFGRRLHDCLLR